jgi:hypothetical protein
MVAGDADASGLIDEYDKSPLWNQWAGETGYLPTDLNCDTQADNRDKDDYWLPNIGEESQVPE